MPLSKIVNTGGGAEREMEEQGRFNPLYFGHMTFPRPWGYWDRNVKREYPSVRGCGEYPWW